MTATKINTEKVNPASRQDDAMAPSTAPGFINLDLEIKADIDLTPLADHLTGKAFILFNGRTDTGYRLEMEPLIAGALSGDAHQCTKHFLTILNTLPAGLKALWEAATSRLFDFGFDSGQESTPLITTLPCSLLLQIANLGADIRITLYPCSDADVEEMEDLE